MSLHFLFQTAPLVNVPVVVGVLSTGFIIVTVVVIIVCLLIVVKYRHRKCEITLLLLLFVHCCCSFTDPIEQVHSTHTTTEIRFVLSHLHVQTCLLTSFHFTSQIFFRYVEKKSLKVKIVTYNTGTFCIEFSA